jgi:hypothetical protein
MPSLLRIPFGALPGQVSFRARTTCHVTTKLTGNNSARISYLQSALGLGPSTTVEACDPCHVGAAIPWRLIGSDGHGAARVKDGEADPGNVPSGHDRD